MPSSQTEQAVGGANINVKCKTNALGFSFSMVPLIPIFKGERNKNLYLGSLSKQKQAERSFVVPSFTMSVACRLSEVAVIPLFLPPLLPLPQED